MKYPRATPHYPSGDGKTGKQIVELAPAENHSSDPVFHDQIRPLGLRKYPQIFEFYEQGLVDRQEDGNTAAAKLLVDPGIPPLGTTD
jgi:hypothetical protein